MAACNAAAPNGFSESCEPPGVYWKSAVAMDLRTGAPQWSYRVQGHDPWVRACGSQPPSVTWCAPEADGEKWDLGGSGPNVLRIRADAHWRDVVGIGEKSGVYVLLDAKTGAFVWKRQQQVLRLQRGRRMSYGFVQLFAPLLYFSSAFFSDSATARWLAVRL
jgi:hypothetical protein